MSRMTAAEVFVFSGRFFQAVHAPLFLSEMLRVMFVLVVSPKNRCGRGLFNGV